MAKFISQFSIFFTLICIIISSDFSLCSRSFEFDPSWPDPSLATLPYHGSGAVPDPDGNLIILTRGIGFNPDRNETIRVNVVIVVDRINGTVLRQWGADLFNHPHGIESASNGDIFITDIRFNQVFRFQYIPIFGVWNINPIITLGQRFVEGNDAAHFCEPADVAVEPETDAFYVADGYCNARVVKFDRYGRFLLQFSAGTPDVAIPIAPFRIVHKVSLAFRRSPNTDSALAPKVNPEDVIVVVADRDNCRIQYFRGNGTFLYEQTHEDLEVPNTFLMSVAYAHVNPMDPPYNAEVQSDFGIVYAVENGQGARPGIILEIALGETNAYVMSRFNSNQSYPFVRRGPLHDLTVSRDGSEVYIVTSNSGTLLVKRFLLTVQDAPGSSFRFYSSMLFVLMATVTGVLLQ